MDRRDFLRAGLMLSATSWTLAACSSTPSDLALTSRTSSPSASPDTSPEPTTGSRVLLAYFSRPGENYYYGERIELQVGNTQVVADMIAAAIALDVYRIDATDPYPDGYEQTVERDDQEEQDDARPAIANALPNVSGYDTVLLGSPVWSVRAPMIMRTFVESVDLAGKTVHPFVTFAVSGMGRVRDDYISFLPDSTVTEALRCRGKKHSRPVLTSIPGSAVFVCLDPEPQQTRSGCGPVDSLIALSFGHQTRAIVRNADRAAALPDEAQIVAGDLSEATTLTGAVAGVDSIVFA